MMSYLIGLSGALGLLIAGLTATAIRGRYLAFLPSDRSVFIAAFVIALAMCSLGIQASMRAGNFRGYGGITGAMLGIPLIVIAVFVFAGKPVPVLGSVRNALAALTVVMAVKWSLAAVQAWGGRG